MNINKLEKDYDEFYEVATTIFEERATTFRKFLADNDTNSNIRLIINSTKRYDIENFNFSIKLEYLFEFPTVDMPIEISISNCFKKLNLNTRRIFYILIETKF